MKKNFVKPAAAAGLCALLAFGGITAGAAYSQDGAQNDLRQKELVQNDRMSFFSGNEFRPAGDRMGMLCIEPGSGSFRMEINGEGGRMRFGEMNDPQQNGQMPGMPDQQQNGQMPSMPDGQQQNGQMPGAQMGGQIQSTADSAGEIVTGITDNSAASLTADYENAEVYTVTDEDGTVKITEAGTYIITGSASEGSITVKKGTTGVVLVLKNLDITSTGGAALSVNKESEVQIIITGNVTLTDNEDPADEYSEDADTADAYDGAAVKVKAGSVVYLTGDGTLTINGSAKNGIKAGDDTSLIIDGDLTININAVNDGINGSYDVTILSGNVTVNAGDDAVHADHILTIGENGEGPTLTVTSSTEALEGTAVNIGGGMLNLTSADDAINAANSDGLYAGELDYSVNVTGGDITISSRADGIDSNGNVNLIDGSVSISSANNGGDAGIDYDGSLYISDDFKLNNQSGVAGPDGMGGMPGRMGGMNGQLGEAGGMPPEMGNMGGMPGNMGGMGGFRPGR